MDVAFCAAGSHIKAPLFNSHSPMVKLNGWHWNWRPVFIPAQTHTCAPFQKWLLTPTAAIPLDLLREFTECSRFCVCFACEGPPERLHGKISWKYNSEYAANSTSKGASDDVLRAHKKLPVKVLCTTLFKLVFLCYLCFHSRSPLEIKDCALNFMIASVNYREI